MSGFRLTEDAQADLVGIRQYTLENWGANQSKKYLEDITQKLLLLSENPSLGKLRVDVAADVYSFLHESHIMYYIVAQEQLVLFAVLHTSMIPSIHLERREKQ